MPARTLLISGAAQHEARLEGVLDGVLVAGLAVDGDGLAHGWLLGGVAGWSARRVAATAHCAGRTNAGPQWAGASWLLHHPKGLPTSGPPPRWCSADYCRLTAHHLLSFPDDTPIVQVAQEVDPGVARSRQDAVGDPQRRVARHRRWRGASSDEDGRARVRRRVPADAMPSARSSWGSAPSRAPGSTTTSGVRPSPWIQRLVGRQPLGDREPEATRVAGQQVPLLDGPLAERRLAHERRRVRCPGAHPRGSRWRDAEPPLTSTATAMAGSVATPPPVAASVGTWCAVGVLLPVDRAHRP